MFDLTDEIVQGGGKIELNGESFENPSMEMLNISEHNLDDHIAKQASAIAYFGVMFKEAERNYTDAKKNWEYKQKILYTDAAKKAKQNDKKSTVKDIEAFMIDENKDEIKRRESDISALRSRMDRMEVFWEGWKQKSFALNNYVALHTSERRIKDNVMDENYNDRSFTKDGSKTDLKMMTSIKKMRS